MRIEVDIDGNITEHEDAPIVPMTAEQLEALKPKVVTMRQARLALLQNNLLSTVDTAIATGSDEAMKIEWEYATEVRRDWASLIAMVTALGMTEQQLDDLFVLASGL